MSLLAGVRHQSRGRRTVKKHIIRRKVFATVWQTTRARLNCQRPQAAATSVFIFKPQANNLTHYQMQLTVVCN